MNTILVTGGAGYIGSHAVLRLLKEGYEVVVFDNLEEGHQEAIERIELFTKKSVSLFIGDLKNQDDIALVLKKYPDICAVLHFAGYIQVGESVKEPIKYYQNNTMGSLNLFSAMLNNGINKLVFSSTAATYGMPGVDIITESTPQVPINPYGSSKLMVEKILDDLFIAKGFQSIRLRYFNVAGADKDGVIGEAHIPESHLIPNVLLAAAGKKEHITIFGDDYQTEDGTCIRDYLFIDDLINAHILALRRLLQEEGICDFYNLGSKNGYSVRQIIEVCKKVTQKDIPVIIGPRREGDPDKLVADPAKAARELNWHQENDIEIMIQTAWKWHQEHPNGYNVQEI